MVQYTCRLAGLMPRGGRATVRLTKPVKLRGSCPMPDFPPPYPHGVIGFPSLSLSRKMPTV